MITGKEKSMERVWDMERAQKEDDKVHKGNEKA